MADHPDTTERKTVGLLVASHHGRDNGYCVDIFNHFTPKGIVRSDKAIVHETRNMTPTYRSHVHPDGIHVATINRSRRVLTTRKDGHITSKTDGKSLWTQTECGA